MRMVLVQKKNFEMARHYYRRSIYKYNPISLIKYNDRKFLYSPLEILGFQPSPIVLEEYERSLNLPLGAPESYYALAENLSKNPITYDNSFIWYLAAKKIGHSKAKLKAIKLRMSFEMPYPYMYSFQEAVDDLNEMLNMNHVPALIYAIELLTDNPFVKTDLKQAARIYKFLKFLAPEVDLSKEDIWLKKIPEEELRLTMKKSLYIWI